MSAAAVALVLAAAGLHAGWNRLLHGSEDRIAVMAVSSLIGGIALSPWLFVSPPWRVGLLIAISACAEAAYSRSLVAAYARGRLSIAYPIARGTAPLVVTAGGIVVLGQTPAPVALSGAVALAGGLGVLAASSHKLMSGASVGFGLATGAFIASYSLVDARAVRTVSPLGYLSAVMLVTGLLLLPSCRKGIAKLPAAVPISALVAVGSVGAYLLVLFAFRQAAAGRVATLREISVLIGIAIAKERPGRIVWLGGALVVAGAMAAGA